MLLVLVLVQQLRREPAEVAGPVPMLLPGARLVETADALHVYTGRRLVSFGVTDDSARAALRRACTGQHDGAHPSAAGQADRDALDLLDRLDLAAPGDGGARRGGIAGDYAATVSFGPPDLRSAAARLDETTVYLLAADDSLAELLRASGLRCARLTDAAGIDDLDPERSVVLAVDRDDAPGTLLTAVNLAALDSGVPWLPVTAYDGAVMHVGPLMLPGVTACFGCLQRRLAANSAFAALHPIVAGAPAAPTPQALRAWAYSTACLVLLHWLGNRNEQLPGQLLTLDPALLQLRRSRVFRVPRCGVCAPPDHVLTAAPWEPARDH